MSSINAVSSPYPFPQTSPVSRSTSASAAAPSTTAAAVTIDAIPASPPAEVLSQMATAAGAQDRLAASGQALHFSLDETTGKLTTQLTDLSGNVLRSVSPSSVLDIAAGGS
jgi:hypothetical protein